jgi:hypothetical protein
MRGSYAISKYDVWVVTLERVKIQWYRTHTPLEQSITLSQHTTLTTTRNDVH